MKQLLKTLLTIVLIPVTAFSAVFTGIYVVCTLSLWSSTDTDGKIMVFVFIIGFIFLLGITSTLYEQCSALHFLKRKRGKTGLEFEHYCAEWLVKHGYREVIVTPATGDYGADLIAKDRSGKRWVFQCKHFSGKVGNSAVQEVVAAKAHYNADCAGVMTNSQLTKKARDLAWENAVELIEGLSD